MDGWTPTRLAPKLPVAAYQTYQAVRPLGSHTRRATCLEVDCLASAQGWATTVDVSTELGRKQANYIRLKAGRSFNSAQAGDQVTFTFYPGQRCFTEHRITLDRPTIYLKRGGDWRATTFDPIPLRETDWVDDFANHQDRLATTLARG